MAHKIDNACDAYRFLKNHPKFRIRERHPVTPEEAKDYKKRNILVTKDRSGQQYRYWRHMFRYAMDCNLDIFYTMVDKNGDVNDKDKNEFVSCWLEFGPIEYSYYADWDDTTRLQHTHDYELDCYGPTFDSALIELALKVKKLYGDYSVETKRDGKCGTPKCGDCAESKRWWREQKKAHDAKKVIEDGKL